MEKLSSGKDQWFLLEGFFKNVSDIINFEANVAKITKAVFLGSEPLNDVEAEIAYHFKLQNRLVQVSSGEEWEFKQIETVRNDICVMLCHETLSAKYREIFNKEVYDLISIEDARVKIKEGKEAEEEGEEKPISDSEV